MGCETIIDKEKGYFCFGCNTTGIVFGPLMWVNTDNDFIEDVAEEFEDFLGKDPRTIDPKELSSKWHEFQEK